jgi:hypothetical protein
MCTNTKEDLARAGPPAGAAAPKKTYTSPELIDWGCVREITQGLKAGNKDFPLAGGSKGV